MGIILITGPASCGKSEWAETLAKKLDQPVIYIATAEVDPNDSEWLLKIEQHQKRRPNHWQTQLVPRDLSATINTTIEPNCLLIDSLGTWVANLLNQDQMTWEKTVTQLVDSLKQTNLDVILVGEETGWGVVPAYPVGRQFRDRLGKLTRCLGSIADTVYLVTGGYVLNLSILGEALKIKD